MGKTHPVYRAHGYHTKVPHLAIVPSILHYTEPGDLVLDGFAGSGMTGVAAQWCGTVPESWRKSLEALWSGEGFGKPRWGARHAILNDLSPAAGFIAANYTLPFDVAAFADAGRALLDEVEAELGLDVRDPAHGREDQGTDRLHRLERGVFLPPNARKQLFSPMKHWIRPPGM